MLLMSTFIGASNRFFNFTNSYQAFFYTSYIYIPVQSILYLYSSLLEICLVIERAVFFLPSRFKKLGNRSEKFFFCLFLFSIVCSIPLFFLFEPAYDDVELGFDQVFRIYYYGKSKFSTSILGRIISYFVYFVRDMLTLGLKIIFNIKTVSLVKNYTHRIKTEKLEFAQKISTVKLHNSSEKKLDATEYISKTDRYQTNLAIIMCLFSLFEHVFHILAYGFYFFDFIQVGTSLYLMGLLCLTLKHTSNFFVFYKFIYLFRTEIKKILSFK